MRAAAPSHVRLVDEGAGRRRLRVRVPAHLTAAEWRKPSDGIRIPCVRVP
jgi:hypothetical protein